ncbi:MAG: hypothetical protein AAB774_02640 [Patescibacteria group bacterium]
MIRPPKPTATELRDFKKLCLEKFGQELTEDEAADWADRLMVVFILTSPKLYKRYWLD